MRSIPPNTADVAIIGSGLAGCSAALTIKQLLPELRVQIFDQASGHHPDDLGESLPPQTNAGLRKLLLWQPFIDGTPQKQHAYHSSWGTPDLNAFDFFATTSGPGWQINKNSFRKLFKDALSNADIPHTILNKTPKISLNDNTVKIKNADNDELMCSCRFIIDATGRRFLMARQHKTKLQHFDRLCMYYLKFELDKNAEGFYGPLVESCPLGWWFSTQIRSTSRGASKPQLLVGLFTDTDIASDHSLKLAAQWNAQLESSRYTVDRIRSQTTFSTNTNIHPSIIGARSTIPATTSGDQWISIGDSAGTYDPLSGQGNYKAISHGLQAGEAIVDLMHSNNRNKLEKYTNSINNNYQQYLVRKREYYSIEQRWKSCTFWRRRHIE